MIIQTNDTLRILMIADQLQIDPKIFVHQNFYDAGYDEGEMTFKLVFSDKIDNDSLSMIVKSPYYKYNGKRYGLRQNYEYVFNYPELKGTKIVGPNHRSYISNAYI